MKKKSVIKLTGVVFLILLVQTCFFTASGTSNLPKENTSLSRYLNTLLRKVYFFTVYPQEAKNKRWEGIVKVKFFVKRDGSIEGLKIFESSGYPILDKAALWAVKSASPYPFPEYYDNNFIKVILPIKFSLMPDTSFTSTTPSSNSNSSALIVTPQNTSSSTTTNTPANTTVGFKQTVSKDKKEIEKKLNTKSIQEISSSIQEISSMDTSDSDINISENLPFPSLTQELKYLVDIAIKNNKPLKIAQEEVKLAELKLREAKRNLYPIVKLQAYNTEGEVYHVKYEERETKISLTQPIYYGGRLRNALRQAQVNMEITQKSYERQKIDVIHKTEVAYYNVVALQMNLEKQKEFVKEAEELFQIIQKQYEEGLVIPLEYNSAKSWLEQLKFQLDSIKQELEMAKLSLKQILNIEKIPSIKTKSLKIQEFNIDLKECINLSLKYRPEIILGKLLVKFSEYGKKIEEGKNKLNIDLSASYGRYEGAYKTESMKSSNNWYVGVKITKPLGANTVTTSLTSDETQPRFGQTSPTKSTTISTEISILDNLKQLADLKNSEISWLKAISQLNETKKSIIFEVQDAFLNYQKALLQLKSALAQRKFREEEIEIIRTKASVGEANLSGVIEALFSLSQAENNYMHALGNYYISLANLRKATGYGMRL